MSLKYFPDSDSNKISTLNTRAAATLAAGATYQGTSEDVSFYGRVGISIYSDNATDGVLTIQVSRDGTLWSTIPRTWANTAIAQPHMWNIVEKYFKILYTNGTTEATNLTIQVQYSNNASILLGHQLNETLLDETEAIVTRSVVVGKKPGGAYENVQVSSQGKLEVELPLTAFGDLRVAELTPIIQNSFEYTVTNTELGTIEILNSGTVTQADAMVVVSTGTTTGSTAEWETTRHAKYKAGLGGLARFTALFTAGVAGTEQMAGLADIEGVSASHKNGYAVGYNGATFSLLRYSNDVLYPVAQTAWDDPMDGTGASGMTLDPTKLNVYYIQFQYLGAGAIKLYIENDATGNMVLAHTLLYSNLNVVPSNYNPNFHLMVHALNNATISDMIIKSSSMAYFVEGKTKYYELQQPQQNTGELKKLTVTTEMAIFTIRNKALYASKTNFIDLIMESTGASIEAGAANNLGKIRLVRNATLGGTPAYADVNTTDSIVDIDTAGTTVTGGKTLFTIPLAGKNDREIINLLPYDIILAPGETLTVAGTSAASATINAESMWKELF